jgi:hypothetical protein
MDSFIGRNDMGMDMMDSRSCDTSGWLKVKKLIGLISYKEEWWKWGLH